MQAQTKIHSVAVIVAAYNRPARLFKLLQQLSNNKTERKFDLIVSIDNGPDQVILSNMADEVDWIFGKKQVILHSVNLGLKSHILKCGDFTNDYELIILLEEDLVVSPYALDFAYECSLFYFDEPSIAGVSLYSYHRKESNKMPFFPLNDGTDIYFMQFASSWGQAWTRSQWTEFRAWLSNNDCDHYNDPLVPKYISNWPMTSWKKHFIRYMIHSNKYFAFPFLGLSTNPGSNGQHHNLIFDLFNSPVLQGRRTWFYPIFSKSKSIYNSQFIPRGDFDINFAHDFVESKYTSDSNLALDFFKLNPFRSYFYIKILFSALVNDFNIFLLKLKKRLSGFVRGIFKG